MQRLKAGYYLHPVPDVRWVAVFLFPRRHCTGRRYDGLINILFFMVILILGLAYAWRKRGTGMEAKKVKVKG